MICAFDDEKYNSKQYGVKMEIKRYKPLIDKYFWIIWITLFIILIIPTILSLTELVAFLIMIGVFVFTFYFMVSSFFSYVELRDKSLYIKFGFIIKKEIPYDKIRDIIKERKLYSESSFSIKNSIEHVVIKYNKFDNVTVSVKNNDDLIQKIKYRINNYE